MRSCLPHYHLSSAYTGADEMEAQGKVGKREETELTHECVSS